ncbi:MAG: ABC transporter permease [Oscillospiraceae bacterium]
MKTFSTMLKTELKLSIRGMDMIIFAICLPVVMMVILGIIYGREPAAPGVGYSFVAQSFGAVACIGICAGGVMGLPLVVSNYRQKKILKRFRVTPVSPIMILVVQVVIYAIYAIVSFFAVYTTAALFFGYRFSGALLPFIGAYFLVMASMFSIGIMVGGVAPNSKIAGILASLLYFPMLIFSGATLPYEVMPPILQRIADIMPLTQGIKLIKATSLGLPVESVLLPTIVMVGLAIICTVVAIRFFRWE